jgi:hypothetical protein
MASASGSWSVADRRAAGSSPAGRTTLCPNPMNPWGAIIAVLIAVRDSDLALATFSAAGLIIAGRDGGAHIERIRSYVTAAQREYVQLGHAEQLRVVLNMVLFLRGELARRQDGGQLEQLDQILLNLGWRLIDNNLVQVALIDPGELARVAEAARAELVKLGPRRGCRTIHLAQSQRPAERSTRSPGLCIHGAPSWQSCGRVLSTIRDEILGSQRRLGTSGNGADRTELGSGSCPTIRPKRAWFDQSSRVCHADSPNSYG